MVQTQIGASKKWKTYIQQSKCGCDVEQSAATKRANKKMRKRRHCA